MEGHGARERDESRALVGGNLLDALSEDDRARLLATGRERAVEAGETVVLQGSRGDCLFVVIEGELAVVRSMPGDVEKQLATARPDGASARSRSSTAARAPRACARRAARCCARSGSAPSRP
jgi:CRP-like cAMP-binding protein